MSMHLKEIIDSIEPVGADWIEKAKDRTQQLVMPPRALGRLHELAERLCGIFRSLTPSVERKAVLVMAADHGVASQGVSAFPQAVTGAMVRTFLRGGAAINAIAGRVQAQVHVVDMGIIPDILPDGETHPGRYRVRKIDRGTKNFIRGPAMTQHQAESAVRIGFETASELFDQGIELLGTGDMGIGNTTAAAAIGAVITGESVQRMVGRGTGVDDEGFDRKRGAIRSGIEINRPNPGDALDVLAKIGGFEIGGIAGAVLAGAYHRRPVVIDGFISTAGALLAHRFCPAVGGYLFAGHRSEEPGHDAMLRYLGLSPILDLGMRLGEGTGGALAMGIMDGAVAVFRDVLTFAQAGVPGKGES